MATGQLLEPGQNARIRHNRAANTIQMQQLGGIRGRDLLVIRLCRGLVVIKRPICVHSASTLLLDVGHLTCNPVKSDRGRKRSQMIDAVAAQLKVMHDLVLSGVTGRN